MESPKTQYAHFHPEDRDFACYCEDPWTDTAPEAFKRPEVRSSAWVEELRGRVERADNASRAAWQAYVRSRNHFYSEQDRLNEAMRLARSSSTMAAYKE